MTKGRKGYVYIPISPKTRDALRKIGLFGDSYDSIIRHLIKTHSQQFITPPPKREICCTGEPCETCEYAPQGSNACIEWGPPPKKEDTGKAAP